MVIVMRRRTKINVNPKHLLIVCIVLLVGLIIFSFRYGEKLSPVKEAVGTVITPMQRGVNTVGTLVSNQLDRFQSISNLIEENEKLKNQLEALAFENNLLLQDKYELDGLRELYELDQKFADYPKVAARVIALESNNWYSVFRIDKGTRDGISKNMNVLAGNGLVGIVTEAHYNYSLVRSIIDDYSSVTGMSQKTADICYVHGDLQLIDEGKIRVDKINKDAKIKEGDEIVTAHTSPNYLQGIPIGYISDIQYDSSNMTKTALLTPMVNFQHLEEVLIITQLKEPFID